MGEEYMKNRTSMELQNQPKISIITPCYNAEKYIEETIESVLNQNYNNIQHIFIDGGSTDRTLEIIEQYPHIDSICERNSGIYDALNRGLENAEGDFIAWINADDMFGDHAFEHFLSEYKKNPQCDLIAGSTIYFDEYNGKRTTRKTVHFTPSCELQHGNITHSGTKLNACFLRRRLVNKVGEFDESLSIAGDTEYLIRIAATKPNAVRTKEVIMKNRVHDKALTHSDESFSDTDETRYREGIRFMREHIQNSDLPKPLYNYCLQDCRSRTINLIKGLTWRGDVTSAIATAISASRFDHRFPLWAILKLIYKYQ